MRKIFQVLVLGSAVCSAIVGSSLFAQEGGQAEQRQHRGPLSPDEELANLTKALHLTTDQQSRIKPILEERQSRLQQLHGDASLSRASRTERMRTLDEDSNTKLEGVLRSDQKAKYNLMIEERRARREAQQRDHGTGDAQPQP